MGLCLSVFVCFNVLWRVFLIFFITAEGISYVRLDFLRFFFVVVCVSAFDISSSMTFFLHRVVFVYQCVRGCGWRTL